MHSKKGDKDLKIFDAKNIVGRAGRFIQHYSGKVVDLSNDLSNLLEKKTEELGFKYYELSKLDNSQISYFINTYFADNIVKSKRLLKSLKDTDILNKMPQTPLTLALITILFDEKGVEISATITDLYRQFVDLLIGKYTIDNTFELVAIGAKHRILAFIAKTMHCDHKQSIAIDDFKKRIEELTNAINIEKVKEELKANEELLNNPNFWNNQKEWLGRIVEVQYFEETENADGNKSLRFPVYKDYRTDKTEADFEPPVIQMRAEHFRMCVPTETTSEYEIVGLIEDVEYIEFFDKRIAILKINLEHREDNEYLYVNVYVGEHLLENYTPEVGKGFHGIIIMNGHLLNSSTTRLLNKTKITSFYKKYSNIVTLITYIVFFIILVLYFGCVLGW